MTVPTPPERDALIARARDALDHGDMGETDAALDPASEWITDAAQMLRADAEEIARLKAALEDIASGELGINVAIKHARRTLEKTPDARCGDAAIRDAVNRLADAEFVCGDYDADDRAAEPGSYKLLVERARDAKHALLALIAARDEQRAAEAARVREEALREGLRAGWLRWREATSDEFGGMLHGHVSGVPNMEAEIDEAIRALREGA